jgi:hypothetical protein
MFGKQKNGGNMHIENLESIIHKVLVLSGLKQEDRTEQLEMQIEAKINEALAYCYRKDAPCCMELPLAEAIANELKADKVTMGIDGNVTSYREGDMSIGFGSGATINGTTVKYGGKLEGFKQIIGAVKCSEMTDVQ